MIETIYEIIHDFNLSDEYLFFITEKVLQKYMDEPHFPEITRSSLFRNVDGIHKSYHYWPPEKWRGIDPILGVLYSRPIWITGVEKCPCLKNVVMLDIEDDIKIARFYTEAGWHSFKRGRIDK
jgi:hypothetical protein